MRTSANRQPMAVCLRDEGVETGISRPFQHPRGNTSAGIAWRLPAAQRRLHGGCGSDGHLVLPRRGDKLHADRHVARRAGADHRARPAGQAVRRGIAPHHVAIVKRRGPGRNRGEDEVEPLERRKHRGAVRIPVTEDAAHLGRGHFFAV